MSVPQTGLYLPQNVMPDTSAFEPSAPTSQIGGLALSAQEGFTSAPITDIGMHLQNLLTQEFSPGKYLSANDYKTSPYFREGLDFPNGVSENVARLRADQFDREQSVNEVLNNMPDGAASDVSRFVGSSIGMALDPVNLAAGFGVEATVGTKAAALLSKLNEAPAIARVAAGTAVRGAEGAAVVTPQALSQYDTENQLGENPSVASIFATIGMGAGLGGVIGGVAGIRSPVTVEADQMAKQTAVNQLATGKSVHVDEILQNGYNQARDIEAQPSLEDMQNVHDQLQTSLNSTNDDLIQEQQNLDDLLFKEKASQTLTPKTSVDSENLVGQLNNIYKKPAALRDANDLSFLNTLPKTDEISDLQTALQKPPFLQDASDRNTISTFQQGKESDALTQRINQHDNDIKQLQDQVSEVPKNHTKVLKNLNDQLSELTSKRAIAQSRLDELQTLNQEPEAIQASRHRITDLMTQKTNLQNELYQHQASMAMTKDAVPPLQGSQIKNASDYMKSYKSDSAYSQPDEERLTNELEGIPDDPYKDITPEEEQVKALAQNDLLDADDKKNLEAIGAHDQQYSIFEKALKATINCLKVG